MKKKRKEKDERSTTESAPSTVDVPDPNMPYGTGKILQRRVFGPEPEMQPLATNEDSWSHLPSTTDPSRGRANTEASARSGVVVGPSGTPGLPPPDQLDDDVFDSPDQERMHLSYAKAAHYVQQQNMGAPQGGYSPPSYYPNMSVYAPSAYLEDYKEPDPYEGAASCQDIFFCVWSLCAYLFDVGSDMWLAYLYYSAGHTWWFILTLIFVTVPALSMSMFSLILYIRDWRIVGEKASPGRWASRIIFLFLQLGPMLR